MNDKSKRTTLSKGKARRWASYKVEANTANHNITSKKEHECLPFIDIDGLKITAGFGLRDASFLVPETVDLVFNFKTSDKRSYFLNNLSKTLVKQLEITSGGKTIYKNDCENVFGLYKDLWKTKGERNEMIQYGVGSENLRKLISGNGNVESCSRDEMMMFSIFGSEQRVPLDRISWNDGLFLPRFANTDMRYLVTLSDAKDVVTAVESEENVPLEYSLENLRLEHSFIDNDSVIRELSSVYRDDRWLYDHTIFMGTSDWNSESILCTERLTTSTKTKAIVLLFLNKTRINSEEFVYPNIEAVYVRVNGGHQTTVLKNQMFDRAKKLFGGDLDQNMTIQKFFDGGFALVIDLQGVAKDNKPCDIILETKKETTSGDIVCKLFTIESDSITAVVGKR